MKVVMLTSASIVAGCASSVAHRVPTWAGGPAYQADIAAWEATAPPKTAMRAEVYAGCMAARGDAAYVDVTDLEFVVRPASADRERGAETALTVVGLAAGIITGTDRVGAAGPNRERAR